MKGDPDWDRDETVRMAIASLQEILGADFKKNDIEVCRRPRLRLSWVVCGVVVVWELFRT